MARSIYCQTCVTRIRENSTRYRERFREVVGALKRGPYRCDACGAPLAEGQEVSCFTTHPKGPEVVVAWEHEYVQTPDRTESGHPRCSQVNCEEPAAYRYNWPGRGVQYACERHVAKVSQVEQALGMNMPIEAIGDAR